MTDTYEIVFNKYLKQKQIIDFIFHVNLQS